MDLYYFPEITISKWNGIIKEHTHFYAPDTCHWVVLRKYSMNLYSRRWCLRSIKDGGRGSMMSWPEERRNWETSLRGVFQEGRKGVSHERTPQFSGICVWASDKVSKVSWGQHFTFKRRLKKMMYVKNELFLGLLWALQNCPKVAYEESLRRTRGPEARWLSHVTLMPLGRMQIQNNGFQILHGFPLDFFYTPK